MDGRTGQCTGLVECQILEVMQTRRFVDRRILRLLCGMVFIFLVSCKPEVPFQYVLQVTVVDENGLPADDVNLSLRNNKTGRSDYQYESKGSGCYEFSILMEMGSYQLWIHSYAADYYDDCRDIILEEDKFLKVQFRLKKLIIF